ncbi:MAG: hypothetical protein PUB49_12445 [Selenomonadaceae bacterium]|nr:hypothetical protein [Selenomonadaceae bacterium]
MQPLYFSCNWTKGPKEYSWSGTNWALYLHLTKHFEMHDIPTGFRHNGIFCLAVGAMNKVRQMLFSRDMDMARMHIMSRVVRQHYNGTLVKTRTRDFYNESGGCCRCFQ